MSLWLSRSSPIYSTPIALLTHSMYDARAGGRGGTACVFMCQMCASRVAIDILLKLSVRKWLQSLQEIVLYNGNDGANTGIGEDIDNKWMCHGKISVINVCNFGKRQKPPAKRSNERERKEKKITNKWQNDAKHGARPIINNNKSSSNI